MLFYKIEGNEGTWLTIIHGLFGSLDNWQTLARQWSHSYKVLSIDVRNHGRSPHYNTMSYDEMIEDKRKDRIAIRYIKKVLPIEKIFVDLEDNTILVIDKNKLWKNSK
jgi:pimeloyl-ACP methyl ester carboxylesterase